MLEVQSLTIDFPYSNHTNSCFLTDFSFNLRAGEKLGIIGESGSGKTLLALALIGLLPEKAKIYGKILFDGEDLLVMDEKQLCSYRGHRIFLIFQEPDMALNPIMTIGDQISEGLCYCKGLSYREARAETLRFLELVRMPVPAKYMDSYPYELSGGQRQRVAIAIALSLQPKLIIADEPTTALDTYIQKEMLTLLYEVVSDIGASMLLISHDFDIISYMTDRVVAISKGKKVGDGSTEEVLHCFSCMDDLYIPLACKTSLPRSDSSEEPCNNDLLLDVQGLTRDYKPSPFRMHNFRALDNVTFSLKKGEIFCIIGQSGSGKSTLARLVMALDQPTYGTVVIDGKEIFSLSPRSLVAHRANFQMVFQEPYSSLNPNHSVGHIVSESLCLLKDKLSKRDRRELVSEMLVKVGLQAEDAVRYPYELSGGQRQRLAIARALIIRPKLIVFDEAISAIDLSMRKKILELIVDLRNKDNISMLFVTHYIAVARQIADYVAVMQAGKIVEIGPVCEVLDFPSHDITRKLISSTLS